MSMRFHVLPLSIICGFAAPVLAQEAPPAVVRGPSKSITLGAVTPALCKLGVGNPASFLVSGSLSDVSGERIGKLRTNLPAMSIAVPGWCNGPSTLTVSAAPMLGPSFTDGPTTSVFSRAVNFRARALGWTPIATAPETLTNATRTGAVLSATGVQARTIPLPTEEIITISLDNFAAASDGLLVQGSYSGTVTITLGAN
jgi:hypothetical protein